MVQFFCEDQPLDRTPKKGVSNSYQFHDINRDKQKLCEKCVEAMKKHKRRIAFMKRLQENRIK